MFSGISGNNPGEFGELQTGTAFMDSFRLDSKPKPTFREMRLFKTRCREKKGGKKVLGSIPWYISDSKLLDACLRTSPETVQTGRLVLVGLT